MWIERLELIGFGNLGGRKIEFKPDKLNVVVEPNEFGKSTIADAIWAVLFDFPTHQKKSDERLKEREARKPLAGGTYKACLDVVHKGRPLRLVRDFEERTLRVFDRGEADREVTSEFLSGPNKDEIGFQLTGMGRELFRKTCFVGQRELDENVFAGDDDLSSLMQSIADASGTATTSTAAVGILQETMAHFPHAGRKCKVEKLIHELEEDKQNALEVVRGLEQERESVRGELARLAEIEDSIQVEDERIKAAEYFQLCVEAAEFDGRLIKAQDRLLRVSDLKRQLGRLAVFERFPIEREKQVEELWTKLSSRLADGQRLQKEFESRSRQAKTRDLELRERWQGLGSCTMEDAQTLSGLARTLETVLSELGEAKQKRKDEQMRVQDSGLDLSNLAGIRNALLSLDAKDLDDAHAYNAMISAAKGQIAECERSVWRARMILTEIDEQRKHKRAGHRHLVFLLSVLLAIFASIAGAMALVVHLPWTHPIVVGSTTIALVVSGFLIANGFLMLTAGSYRRSDAQTASGDDQKQAGLAQELHNKIMGMEIRLEDLARKAGLASGAELVGRMQAYATAAAQLKDLDLLDQVIVSRDAQVIKLAGEIEGYTAKAGRGQQEITPESAFKLAEDIYHYMQEARGLEATTGSLDQQHQQMQFLSDEVRDLNALLIDHFRQAGSEHPEEIELGHGEFIEAAKSYRQWEALRTELNRMEQDGTTDLVVSELPKIIEKLQLQRDSVWARIEELVAASPEIAGLPPPVADPHDFGYGRALVNQKVALDELRHERGELTGHIRAACKDYDDHYVETLDKVEELERGLESVKCAKAALELASETFKRLAEETHENWSSKLNEISKHMLASINTDYESLLFDKNLRLTARRRGQSEPLQPAQIRSQISGGTREQLHWLARMAVSRFLSQDVSLPVILDEPFSESDDKRFLSLTRFLLSTLLKQHQIIMFSCHQVRHRWLLERLSDDERRCVETCQLEELDA